MTNISNETHDTSSRFKQTQKIDDLYCFSFYTVYNVTSFHLYSVVQFRCTLGIHLTYSLSKVRPKDVRSLSTVEVDSVRFLIKRFAITLSSVLDDPSWLHLRVPIRWSFLCDFVQNLNQTSILSKEVKVSMMVKVDDSITGKFGNKGHRVLSLG